MRPEGRDIILTGGCGGIGSSLRDLLRDAGARVQVIDRTPGSGVLQADLSDSDDLDRVCDALARRPVDCLINLAGMLYFGHLPGQSPDHLAAMLRVNLEAPIRLTQAVLPGMLERGRGQIVNIGSVYGGLPFPHFASYSATKAGLQGFSEALRREYAGKGIVVSHVAPRAVSTALNSGLIPELHRRTGVVNDNPRQVAAVILDTMIRERRSRTLGLTERFAIRLNALSPALIDRVLSGKRDIADRLLDSHHPTEENHHAKTI